MVYRKDWKWRRFQSTTGEVIAKVQQVRLSILKQKEIQMNTCNWFIGLGLMVSIVGCDTLNETLKNSTEPINLKEISVIFEKPDPITTNFADTKAYDTLPNSFGNNIIKEPLYLQPRSNSGGYILFPGFYEMDCKSYCMH